MKEGINQATFIDDHIVQPGFLCLCLNTAGQSDGTSPDNDQIVLFASQADHP